jgi:hypothetical protein
VLTLLPRCCLWLWLSLCCDDLFDLKLLCYNSFVPRHNSTTPAELQEMVSETGFNSLDDLITATVPRAIM